MRTAFVGAVEGSAVALGALIRAGMSPGLVITLTPNVSLRHSDYVDLTPLAKAGGSEIIYAADVNGPDVIEARPSLPNGSGACNRLVTDLRRCLPLRCQYRQHRLSSLASTQNAGQGSDPLDHSSWRGCDCRILVLARRWRSHSGPILLQEPIAVAADETARTLYAKQTDALARMLPKALELVRSGKASRIEQDHSLATYCAKRTADDGLIDWREPAAAILRLVRAVGAPYPGAFTTCGGRRLIVDAATSFADSHRHIGLPGQVQCHTSEGFAVRCGDGQCINITAWRQDQVASKPRVHSANSEQAPRLRRLCDRS